MHAAVTRVAKVVRDFHELMELKARAEAADIAKSQVIHHFNFVDPDLCSKLESVIILLHLYLVFVC